MIPEAVTSFRRLVAGFPPRRREFEPGSGYVGFVVNKAALRQVLSEYSVFLANRSTDCSTLIIIHHQPGLVGASVPPHPKVNKIPVDMASPCIIWYATHSLINIFYI
jgi:hypothetical protein